MGTDAGMLQKVRALLAKAEATPFDAEAEAFTAKAQELIARYRIDHALLDAHAGGATALTRRIGVEDPYLRAKVVLVSVVADANDCRAVWPRGQRSVELFGFPADLDAVEELFTSLLVQATAAMRRAGSKRDAWGRSRTTVFRRAFLMSFAVRIGERLRETVAATVDAVVAETGGDLVPVLAARTEAVEGLVRATHPALQRMRATVSDADGWRAGTAFANQADLGGGRSAAAELRS